MNGRDVDLPPKESRHDTDEYLQYLADNGAEQLADYLHLLRDDYYNGELTNSDRYMTVTAEGDTDIGRLLDLAVVFGWVWEREDPIDGTTEADT